MDWPENRHCEVLVLLAKGHLQRHTGPQVFELTVDDIGRHPGPFLEIHDGGNVRDLFLEWRKIIDVNNRP